MQLQKDQFNAVKQIKEPQEFLFNIVSSCFMKEIRYYDNEDQRSELILQALDQVKKIDPEFILQLALYLRNRLYIRSTTNFIMAYCSIKQEASLYLKKYFSKTILLPTDMIEVCQFVQYIKYSEKFGKLEKELKKIDIRKNIKIPKALQNCVCSKFAEFSEYQLGKYCSEGNRKKILFNYLQAQDFEKYNSKIQEKIDKKKKSKKTQSKQKNTKEEQQQSQQQTNEKQEKVNQMVISHNQGKKKSKILEEAKNWWEIKFLCMKDLIRLCHIKKSQYMIKCVLNTKYPQTEEEFNTHFSKEEKEKFQLSFNSELVNSKFKLKVPET